MKSLFSVSKAWKVGLAATLLVAVAVAVAVAGAVALATAAPSSAAPSPVVLLAGVVRSEDGAGVANVEVVVNTWPSQEVMKTLRVGDRVPQELIATVTTDADGNYKVTAADVTGGKLPANANLDITVTSDGAFGSLGVVLDADGRAASSTSVTTHPF